MKPIIYSYLIRDMKFQNRSRYFNAQLHSYHLLQHTDEELDLFELELNYGATALNLMVRGLKLHAACISWLEIRNNAFKMPLVLGCN